METSINTSGEFYSADFGYFSMSVYSVLFHKAESGEGAGCLF